MNAIARTKTETLAAYGRYYATLQPDTVQDLHELVTPDFRFTDPFTHLCGPDKVCAYLAKTFTDTQNPTFEITHQATDSDMGFLRWTFHAQLPVIGDWRITGMTELTFSEDGSRVASHIDHWDASQYFYARIPVLGWIIRRLARRIAAL